jgi:hypothetical protein
MIHDQTTTTALDLVLRENTYLAMMMSTIGVLASGVHLESDDVAPKMTQLTNWSE